MIYLGPTFRRCVDGQNACACVCSWDSVSLIISLHGPIQIFDDWLLFLYSLSEKKQHLADPLVPCRNEYITAITRSERQCEKQLCTYVPARFKCIEEAVRYFLSQRTATGSKGLTSCWVQYTS